MAWPKGKKRESKAVVPKAPTEGGCGSCLFAIPMGPGFKICRRFPKHGGPMPDTHSCVEYKFLPRQTAGA